MATQCLGYNYQHPTQLDFIIIFFSKFKLIAGSRAGFLKSVYRTDEVCTWPGQAENTCIHEKGTAALHRFFLSLFCNWNQKDHFVFVLKAEQIPQTKQAKAGVPVWVLRWFLSNVTVRNALPQRWHLCGLSSVWLFMWRSKLERRGQV